MSKIQVLSICLKNLLTKLPICYHNSFHTSMILLHIVESVQSVFRVHEILAVHPQLCVSKEGDPLLL